MDEWKLILPNLKNVHLGSSRTFYISIFVFFLFFFFFAFAFNTEISGKFQEAVLIILCSKNIFHLPQALLPFSC